MGGEEERFPSVSAARGDSSAAAGSSGKEGEAAAGRSNCGAGRGKECFSSFPPPDISSDREATFAFVAGISGDKRARSERSVCFLLSLFVFWLSFFFSFCESISEMLPPSAVLISEIAAVAEYVISEKGTAEERALPTFEADTGYPQWA